MRVSTLLELARALQLEPMLIPKEHAPAVRGLLDHLQGSQEQSDLERARFS